MAFPSTTSTTITQTEVNGTISMIVATQTETETESTFYSSAIPEMPWMTNTSSVTPPIATFTGGANTLPAVHLVALLGFLGLTLLV